MIYSPEADILARIERCQGFEWDEGNSDKNWLKHGVTNEKCEEVLDRRPIHLDLDRAHSSGEQRFQALGQTSQQRLLFVAFTIRGDRIRVISARDMNQKERVRYLTP
jgi:uncharacterized DUF497 family protein